MGMAGINEARNMNNDNINNLNNSGAMLVNEMRNNIIPQLDLLVEIRNGLGNSQQDIVNRLDALIAVINRDQEIIVNVPPMDQQAIQEAFEQAYINLHLPTRNDIGDILNEMRDGTAFVGDKIEALGHQFSSITAENLETILGVVQTSQKQTSKKTPSKGRKMTEPIDDFISKNFTSITFDNSFERVNNFAATFGIATETKGQKQRSMTELIKDINSKVIVPLRLIRANILTGYQFTDREMMSLCEAYRIPHNDPSLMDKISQEYSKAEEYIISNLIEGNVYADSSDGKAESKAEENYTPSLSHGVKEVVRVFDQNVIDTFEIGLDDILVRFRDMNFQDAPAKLIVEKDIKASIDDGFQQLVKEYPNQVSEIQQYRDDVDVRLDEAYKSNVLPPVKSKAEIRAEAKAAKEAEAKAKAPKPKSYTKTVERTTDSVITNLIQDFNETEFKTLNSKKAAEDKLTNDIAIIYKDLEKLYPESVDKLRSAQEEYKIILARRFEEKKLKGQGFKLFMKHKGLGENKPEHNKTYKLIVREPVNKPHVKLPKKIKRKTRYVL